MLDEITEKLEEEKINRKIIRPLKNEEKKNY